MREGLIKRYIFHIVASNEPKERSRAEASGGLEGRSVPPRKAFVRNFTLLSDHFSDIFLRRLLDITRTVQQMLIRRVLSDCSRKF